MVSQIDNNNTSQTANNSAQENPKGDSKASILNFLFLIFKALADADIGCSNSMIATSNTTQTLGVNVQTMLYDFYDVDQTTTTSIGGKYSGTGAGQLGADENLYQAAAGDSTWAPLASQIWSSDNQKMNTNTGQQNQVVQSGSNAEQMVSDNDKSNLSTAQDVDSVMQQSAGYHGSGSIPS